jgi:hypothetical protein
MERYIAAGILALAMGTAPIFAQTSQDAPPAQSTQKPPQKASEKPKKVWTNDDLADLRSTVTITTASATPAAEGEAAGEAQAAGAVPGKEVEPPPEKDPKYYKSKLDPLRKQLAEVDAKIKEIQGAISNPYQGTNKININQQAPSNPSQGPEPPNRPDDSLYGNQIVRPQDQLAYYQKRHDELQQQIDDLENQALRNGLNRSDIQ